MYIKNQLNSINRPGQAYGPDPRMVPLLLIFMAQISDRTDTDFNITPGQLSDH